MGLQLRKKDKYRPSRRKFGQACGRRSNSAKKTEKKRVMKAEEIANFYDSDKGNFQFPSYQLVRKKCSLHGLYTSQSFINFLPSFTLCRVPHLPSINPIS